jgi:hypothetical protein
VYAVGSGPTATIYAATDSGLSVSTDGGANWAAYFTTSPGGLYYPWYGDSGGLGSDHVYGGVYAVGSGPAARIYAATDGGLSISTALPIAPRTFIADFSPNCSGATCRNSFVVRFAEVGAKVSVSRGNVS